MTAQSTASRKGTCRHDGGNAVTDQLETVESVLLSARQRRHLAALLRTDIRRDERRIANRIAEGREFVPKPGRRDAAKWQLERWRELLRAIEGDVAAAIVDDSVMGSDERDGQ